MTQRTHVSFPARCAGAATAFLLFASLAQAQSTSATPASGDSAPAQAIPVEKVAPSSNPDSEVITMSVFEVNADDDKGYLASSTLSGTRLNSKLEDLAASISVVTKEQLTDLASTDINDIFMYEANTEGIHQYSDFTNDRGNITDNIALSPQTANRVRGLGSANLAIGSFNTLGTIPIDTYNIDSVEITRGPNSTIFGLGNSGGSVNINPTSANPSKDVNRVTLSVTNSRGRRASFDFNRVLLKDKLAIRVNALYDDKHFDRQPAEEITRRLQAAVFVKPLKGMTIRGSFESYRNQNSRPNSYTPRNMYADWVASGSPTWDPITETVHLQDGTSFVVTEKNEKTLLPYGLSVYDGGLGSRHSWYTEDGEVKLMMVNRTSTTALVNNVSGKERLLLNGTWLARDSALNTTMPLYTVPGTTDKGYYDWSSINLAAPNWARVRGETYRVQLEQFFLQTSRQVLALQAGWFREKAFTESRAFIGASDGARMQVYIDVNEKLLDGTPNPYFLRPFIGGSEPAYKKKPEINDNYRATLAYQLDLTKEKSWLKWIGKHSFAGYGEYRYDKTGSFIYRDRIVSDENWFTSKTGSTKGSHNLFPRYYVGDNVGQNVDYSPVRLKQVAGEYNLRWYNGVSKTWQDEPVTVGESFGGGQNTKKLNSTVGGVWQAYLLKDRIIPTLGWREDRNRSRKGDSAGPATEETGWYYDTSTLDNFTTQPWIYRKGRTKNKGVVIKPLDWFFVHYNESDSFKPASVAYNVWGDPLPDPQGNSKDYGFTLKLLKDKLQIRATQYETYDVNARSTLGTIVQRAIRLDADGGKDTGSDPDLDDFLTTELQSLHADWTPEQLDAEVSKLMKLDPAHIDSHRNQDHSDVNDALSKGKEIEIIYNPTNYWTIKANVTQQKAMDTNLSPELQNYINYRWDTWTTIRSPASGELWWKSTIGSTTPENWFYSNVNKDLKLATATAGKYKSQTREWRGNLITRFNFSGVTKNRWLRPLELMGAMRYEGKVGIGYLAGAPDIDGIVRTLDATKPVYDKARTSYDVGFRYNFKLGKDKVQTQVQLNVTNLFEDGSLRVVGVNPDGSPYQYRIIDPRRITASVTFDL